MEEKGAENGVAAMAACYQGFDPAAYLQTNYTSPQASADCQKTVTICHASRSSDVSGELLVDIGSGPTLYQVMSGCEVFNKVLLTDFLEVNRQELRSWLQDEGGCSLDWTPYLQHVPIEVHRPQPLALDVLPAAGADCLVSCYCLESVSPDLAAFTRALGHIGRLLRPRGHLLLIGALGMSYYFGGPGVKIPTVPVNEAQVCASLKESGYTLIRLEVYTVPQDIKLFDDASAVFFVKAMKE
ncbi:phenylethanolamine N-methyltransferase-like [Perca flavescens]|uniref:phenylethanolamine N-methyltransferase-like n=1 Tax=Perca flavescens TaxID=8167 RepID=UPI00106EA83B|nr:phenylethanolamine N-methyltransferase-like [Perca flavescens]